MSDLRKLIDHLEHIEQGGELIRELDPATGRIVSKPVTENIGKLIGAAAGGAGLALGANWLKDKFSSDKPGADKPGADKPGADKPGADKPGNISDFPSSSGDNKLVPINPNSIKRDQSSGPIGNYNGPQIDPINDDPADPKTWPPGVKPAPDFGYLDPNGMWIPTPFYVRTENGNWKIPRGSPAFPEGYVKDYTPFKKKEVAIQWKNSSNNASLIEQSKPVKLPDGAPQIPGYKQVDVGKFSTATGASLGPTDTKFVYAYQNGKNIILIAPELYYNMKISIGRHYPGWTDVGIRDFGDSQFSGPNGKVHVSSQNFNVNDMILSVVVHSTEPNIGSQILKSLAGSLKPA